MKPYYGPHSGITIYHADWRDVVSHIGPVDHVITDPPYAEATHANHVATVATNDGGTRAPLTFDCLSGPEFAAMADRMVHHARRWVVMTCDYRHAPLVYDRDYFVRHGVWLKQNGAPQFTGDRPGMGYEPVLVLHRHGRKQWNGGGKHGVWFAAITGGAHPAQKPEALAAAFVIDFTSIGDTVLDPYMGSGTTLVACKRLGRCAIGIDISERYCEMAAKRLQQETLPLFGSSTDDLFSTATNKGADQYGEDHEEEDSSEEAAAD